MKAMLVPALVAATAALTFADGPALGDIGKFKPDFNEAHGSVRLVVILSPS